MASKTVCSVPSRPPLPRHIHFPEVRNTRADERASDVGFLSKFIIFTRPATPQAFGALVKADIDKRWPIIKAANIKAE
jgi:hypothetical protein